MSLIGSGSRINRSGSLARIILTHKKKPLKSSPQPFFGNTGVSRKPWIFGAIPWRFLANPLYDSPTRIPPMADPRDVPGTLHPNQVR